MVSTNQKNVCCLLRARSSRYCALKEASKIRRLRYICGGEDGRVARGSEGTNGVADPEDVELAVGAAAVDATAEGDLETTACTEVPGGGAPLTTWSSFEPDMIAPPLAIWLDFLSSLQSNLSPSWLQVLPIQSSNMLISKVLSPGGHHIVE